jgi:hypothetical protein
LLVPFVVMSRGSCRNEGDGRWERWEKGEVDDVDSSLPVNSIPNASS